MKFRCHVQCLDSPVVLNVWPFAPSLCISRLRTACLYLQLLPHVNWDVDDSELSAATKMTSACEIATIRIK